MSINQTLTAKEQSWSGLCDYYDKFVDDQPTASFTFSDSWQATRCYWEKRFFHGILSVNAQNTGIWGILIALLPAY